MIEELNSELQILCDNLNRQSLNYCAAMQVFAAPNLAGQPLANIVKAAVSTECKVGGHGVSSADELIREFTAAASFEGATGAYPNPEFVSSSRCKEMVATLAHRLRNIAIGDDVYEFWLAEGHPFYPVFWDFAFVIERNADAYVFIGSSSD